MFNNVLGYHFQRPKQTKIFIRDKSSFKAETYCDDMNKSVNKFFEHFDDLMEENFD